MHPLHDYLCHQLGDMLERRCVVVFYDSRNEFLPFFEELTESGKGFGEIPRIFIGEHLTFLVRFDGSFFALRAAVEPIVALDKPERLILYIPGIQRDRHGSVLMELEKAGACYEPQLKRLALNVLRKKYTDGQIDEMLRPASVTYQDIVSYMAQADQSEPASVLRAIFEGVPSEMMISRWLADESKDSQIESKGAFPELLKLVESRIGLHLKEEMKITEARARTLRHVLLGEFRSDLKCEAPASLDLIPAPKGKDQIERVRNLAGILRSNYPERYVELSNRVASELCLASLPIKAADLGRIDTFVFEERKLLAHAEELIIGRDYSEALEIAAERSRSFWVDREVARQAQWELCRIAAELGQEIERVSQAVSRMNGDPANWIGAYSAQDGWHRIDVLQRRLETWAAKMDDDPEIEKAIAVIRREHEDILKRMAEGFGKAFAKSGWTVAGVLHQTRIYPDVVQQTGGRTAYFVVDAMRFEMGAELAKYLHAASDVTLRPAVAAMPTVTPVGMAALLPGASASFTIVDSRNKLAADIEGSRMSNLTERLKFLKAKVPGVFDITLGKLLNTSSPKLAKMIDEASLVFVRSQEIDFIGELDGDLLARQVMDTVIGNIARAVKKLSYAGIEHFVITADHGHQFSIRKDEDMRTDSPGGNTVEIHRRCWAGRGGTTPPGTVRITGAELGYATDLEFVFPTGLGIFKASGGLAYHHGGYSLQELVVPVLSFRMPLPKSKQPKPAAKLRGLPERITNRTFGIRVLAPADLFGTEPVLVRVILISGGEQVGQAGMAVSAEFDRNTGVLRIQPGIEASVGLMLTRDDCASLRVVIIDPNTDAVIDQSADLPVSLGV